MALIRTQLRRPTRQETAELSGLFIAHFIGGLLPLWGSWLLLVLGSEAAPVSEFFRHGEFLLYAASLLPTAAFLMLRDLKTPFPFRLPLGLLIILLLVLSTLLFAGVFIMTRHGVTGNMFSVDLQFLARISIPLYICSLFVTLLATFFDMLIINYNPLEKQEQDERDLANEFRHLKE